MACGLQNSLMSHIAFIPIEVLPIDPLLTFYLCEIWVFQGPRVSLPSFRSSVPFPGEDFGCKVVEGVLGVLEQIVRNDSKDSLL